MEIKLTTEQFAFFDTTKNNTIRLIAKNSIIDGILSNLDNNELNSVYDFCMDSNNKYMMELAVQLLKYIDDIDVYELED